MRRRQAVGRRLLRRLRRRVPNIDLTISTPTPVSYGFVTLAIGRMIPETAVPESSTWAMMLVGFAGLGV